MSWVEAVGYLASALIVASLAMTSVVRLRLISLLGSVTYVVYGAMIESVPVMLTNAIVAGLNIYFLQRELRRGGREFHAVPISGDQPFLEDFLSSHEADIRRFQPDFDGLKPGDQAWILMRDGMPGGIVAGRVDGAAFDVTLDYVLPAWRDGRLGGWFLRDGAAVLRDSGITALRTQGNTPTHASYLLSMGFVERARGVFTRDL